MTTPNAEVHVRKSSTTHTGSVRGVAFHSLVSIESRQALRLAAMATDAHATADLSLSLLWRELVRGAYKVVDHFFSEVRCYVVLSAKSDGIATPMLGRRLEILESVLSGLPQKNIASDLDLAPSTVALNSRLGLESLGVSGKPSRAHPLLMLAARASCTATPTLALAKCSTFVTLDEGELRVIGTPRPDRDLGRLLPPAELAVIRRLIEGLSYADIARERGTSTRTIANQITAVFRRLRVSGRSELIQRLFSEECLPEPIATPINETLVPRDASDPKPRDAWRDARRSA